MSVIKWVSTLVRIVREYDREQHAVTSSIANLKIEMESAVRLIRERTEVHADLRLRDNNIIVIGRYKNRDYIQIHSMGSVPFGAIVEQLKHQQRMGQLKIVDAAPSMKAVIHREL